MMLQYAVFGNGYLYQISVVSSLNLIEESHDVPPSDTPRVAAILIVANELRRMAQVIWEDIQLFSRGRRSATLAGTILARACAVKPNPLSYIAGNRRRAECRSSADRARRLASRENGLRKMQVWVRLASGRVSTSTARSGEGCRSLSRSPHRMFGRIGSCRYSNFLLDRHGTTEVQDISLARTSCCISASPKLDDRMRREAR